MTGGETPTQPEVMTTAQPVVSFSSTKTTRRKIRNKTTLGPQKSSKATAVRSRDVRLPTTRTGSVFDRLYKTQTAASRAWTPARKQARRAKPLRAPVEEDLDVFTRLHITGTISNTSKRLTHKHKIRYTPEKKKLSPMKTPIHTPAAKKTRDFVFSPRMKPITKIYFDSKYHPGIGLETVEPIKMGYSFFQAFCEYENGNLDSQQIAKEIILAFFKKDFPAGRHWQLHEPSVEERVGEVKSYDVKMSATYNWSDGYRVATAQGVVECKPEQREVRVINYIYDVSGDP